MQHPSQLLMLHRRLQWHLPLSSLLLRRLELHLRPLLLALLLVLPLLLQPELLLRPPLQLV